MASRKWISAAISVVRSSRTSFGSLAPLIRSAGQRSEEHTSELQSQSNLVCRLLLEKKKNVIQRITFAHSFTQKARHIFCYLIVSRFWSNFHIVYVFNRWARPTVVSTLH